MDSTVNSQIDFKNENRLDFFEQDNSEDVTNLQKMLLPRMEEGGNWNIAALPIGGDVFLYTMFIITKLLPLVTINKKCVRAMILAPNRERANYIQSLLRDLTAAMPLRSLLLTGGVSTATQYQLLRKPYPIIVGTPRRIAQLLEKRIDTTFLEYLILDGADQLLQTDFKAEILYLLSKMPFLKQRLLFSEKYLPFQKISMYFSSECVFQQINFIQQNDKPLCEQYCYLVQNLKQKLKLFFDIIQNTPFVRLLVYVETLALGEVLAKILEEQGLGVMTCFSKSQTYRGQPSLNRIERGEFRILISMDRVMQHVDLQEAGISHIIHFDLPAKALCYEHRLKALSSFEEEGQSLLFVSPRDFLRLTAIEEYLGDEIERCNFKDIARIDQA